MRKSNVLTAAERAVDEAKKQGALHADAVAIAEQGVEIEVRGGAVERLVHTESFGVGVRVFCAHREGLSYGTSATTRADADGIREAVARALAQARIAAPDPEAVPPVGAEHPSEDEVRAWQARAHADARWNVEEAKKAALALEAEARAVPEVASTEGAGTGFGRYSYAYAASDGFAAEYSRAYAQMQVVAVARRAGEMQRDYAWKAAIDAQKLPPPEALGREAGERAARRLGARDCPTGRFPVVFEPRVAVSLLGHLAHAINGRAVMHRHSFLADRLGERIFPDFVTITDDPQHPDGLTDRLFDGEGVRCRRLAVVENGKLTSFLTNRYVARRLNHPETGHATRGLVGDIGIGPSNLWLSPGAQSAEAILAELGEGLWVTELTGFGVREITGDYSRGAAGFWFKDGEIAYPVQGATIAGNLLEMFAGICALGDDLQWFGSVAAPTVAVAEMTLASEGGNP